MHDSRSSILSGGRKPILVPPKKGAAEDAGRGGLGKIKVRREEARTVDQRAEERFRDRVANSTIRFRGDDLEVAVINVSSRGAMIESDIAPRIGEGIEIRFSAQTRTSCRVRWLREGRIGLEFADDTIVWDCSEPHRAAYDRLDADAPVEREQRHQLFREGILSWSGMSIKVQIRNISRHGANVEGERSLWEGAEVELDLGEAGWQMAQVRWVQDRQLGLRFYAPVDLDKLAITAVHSEADAPEEPRAPTLPDGDER
jgi:hypothetical protein